MSQSNNNNNNKTNSAWGGCPISTAGNKLDMKFKEAPPSPKSHHNLPAQSSDNKVSAQDTPVVPLMKAEPVAQGFRLLQYNFHSIVDYRQSPPTPRFLSDMVI